MTRIKTFVGVAASLLTMATSAPLFASPAQLPPNDFESVYDRATTPAADGATVFGGPVSSPFVASSGGFTGLLITTVYAADPGNPWFNGDLTAIPGALTFEYKLFNDATSTSTLKRMLLDNWGGSVGVATEQLTGKSDPAAFADRSIAPGAFIGFDLIVKGSTVYNGIDPGGSATLYLYSTSSGVTPGIANIIDGGVAYPATYAPDLALVPEPATMIAGAMLLLPFGASTLRILRNRFAA